MSIEPLTPAFEHDCDECVFLGRYEDHDLYLCPQGGMPTVVARWGNDGPEYTSGREVTLGNLTLMVER